jgi:hypothetical protein
MRLFCLYISSSISMGLPLSVKKAFKFLPDPLAIEYFSSPHFCQLSTVICQLFTIPHILRSSPRIPPHEQNPHPAIATFIIFTTE